MKNVAGHVAFLYNRYIILDEQALIQDENLQPLLINCKIF
jgi:hypothetical protein